MTRERVARGGQKADLHDEDRRELDTRQRSNVLRNAAPRFHDLLDRTEPWVHELARSDAQFERVGLALTAAMVNVELLMWLLSGLDEHVAGVLFDDAATTRRVTGMQGPRETDREGMAGKRRAWRQVWKLRNAAPQFCGTLKRAGIEARELGERDPASGAVARVTTAALLSVGSVIEVIGGLRVPAALYEEVE
jgi:hypothetical protein